MTPRSFAFLYYDGEIVDSQAIDRERIQGPEYQIKSAVCNWNKEAGLGVVNYNGIDVLRVDLNAKALKFEVLDFQPKARSN